MSQEFLSPWHMCHLLEEIEVRGPSGTFIKKPTFNKAYKFVIHPLKGETIWKKTGLPKLLPLLVKKKVGRPAIKRRKDLDEPKSSGKMSRRRTLISCSLCKQYGHNKTSYKKKSQSKDPEPIDPTCARPADPTSLPLTQTPPANPSSPPHCLISSITQDLAPPKAFNT